MWAPVHLSPTNKVPVMAVLYGFQLRFQLNKSTMGVKDGTKFDEQLCQPFKTRAVFQNKKRSHQCDSVA